jgi:hypothetical protein
MAWQLMHALHCLMLCNNVRTSSVCCSLALAPCIETCDPRFLGRYVPWRLCCSRLQRLLSRSHPAALPVRLRCDAVPLLSSLLYRTQPHIGLCMCMRPQEASHLYSVNSSPAMWLSDQDIWLSWPASSWWYSAASLSWQAQPCARQYLTSWVVTMHHPSRSLFSIVRSF